MEPREREAYIQTNINDIIQEQVFSDPDGDDWAVRCLRHKGQWTIVEAVQRTEDCTYSEVLLILTFVKGLPPDLLAVYLMESGVWTLYSHAQGMQFDKAIYPGALPPVAAAGSGRKTRDVERESSGVADHKGPEDKSLKPLQLTDTRHMKALFFTEQAKALTLYGGLCALAFSFLLFDAWRKQGIAGLLFVSMLISGSLIVWRLRTGITIAIWPEDQDCYRITRWMGICPPLAAHLIFLLTARTSKVSTSGHIVIREEIQWRRNARTKTVYAIKIERAGKETGTFSYNTVNTYIQARTQAEALSDALRMPLVDCTFDACEKRAPGTMNEPLRDSAPDRSEAPPSATPPRGARFSMTEANQEMRVEIPPRPFMLKTYTAIAALINVDIMLLIAKFALALNQMEFEEFRAIQIFTNIVLVCVLAYVFFYDRQTTTITAGPNGLRITETLWFIRHTTIFTGQELEGLSRRQTQAPFYMPSATLVASSDRKRFCFAYSLPEEHVDFLCHILLKALRA